ncbi:large conductance mechanosensitive channel protein MscL [Phormidesmis priestleyi ULC007]|uniref:Large-conductance mechanosensitive channel n=1 Tax=Phormidesmis priestleyi ULC007 TaxID=1920490 RepID=A0A2T1DCL7_9CYAN|nr:large conductance mechanosensitive channel protein MscL [Phormidesmis priestleyi]PSB18193.1 large conductance mechanosensitive channel protein MscL [Phormidesmis priestleyi ULC007]PZO49464.1 MAG: large conductance mechanosensitive channel protein MscL [Phormidesmis priestleyi]
MARSGFLADFQKFLMRGNVIDLAVAVIIGSAFNQIVTSLVEDIITPVILNPALQAAKVDNLQSLNFNGIKYGVFLAAIINFIVIAFSIFLLIRAFEKAKKRFQHQEAVSEAEAADPVVLSQERLTGAIERLTSSLESR